jgi:hypothetical protein
LSFLGLLEDIANDKTQTTRRIQADLKWFRGEELLHARDPEPLDGVEIRGSFGMDSIQQSDIFAHIADASAACPAALGGQHPLDPVSI